MSVPPYSPPPGSYYAPPPPQSSSGGCWKAAAIGCGVMLLLGILGIVAFVGFIKKSGAIDFGMKSARAQIGGKEIQAAIVSYHTKHGSYPDNLQELESDGELTDSTALHNDLDSDADPSHVSWTYTKPPEGAPGYTPILEERYTAHLNIAGSQTSQPGVMTINLDGTTSSTSTPAFTPAPPQPTNTQ